MFTGRRLLFARHRLFANRFLAMLLGLVLRLFTFGGRGLLIGRGLNRLGLRHGFSGRGNLGGWWLFGRCGLDLLILLALFLARVVVVRRRYLFGGRCLLGRLLGRLFGGRRFDLLLVALLLARLQRLLVGCRCGLFGRLIRRCGLDLLLLVTLLLARLQLLLVGRGCCLFGGLIRWRGLDLLLLIALLPARLLLFSRRGLFSRSLLGLLLLIAFLPARLLLFGRSGLFSGSLLGLLLLVALLLARLLFLDGRCRLLGGWRCLFGLLAFLFARQFLVGLLTICSRVVLDQDQWRGRVLQGAENGVALQRGCAQRRGCHQQAKCRTCQYPWLAFHHKFSLWGPIPAQTFIIRIGSGLWTLSATKDD
ncbi:hypothetical protein [Mesorhizobium neociceri]|uniref:hypothetical protein n=1 Tax=Mesorhizobium neociceri TaxID=1307853 RepID=UPI001F30F6EC|nr:hypothetical protein [Mesorhizobium neociceri]